MSDKSEREMRKHEYCTGWMQVVKSDDHTLIIDVFMDVPPNRFITTEELSNKLDISRNRTNEILEHFKDLGIVTSKKITDTSYQYSFNHKNPIVWKNWELHNAAQAVRKGTLPKSIDEDEYDSIEEYLDENKSNIN